MFQDSLAAAAPVESGPGVATTLVLSKCPRSTQGETRTGAPGMEPCCMKALRIVLVFVAFASVTLPASAEMFGRPLFGTPNGQKKVGQYVWVWASKKVQSGGSATIEADCPMNYVVLGGGSKNPVFMFTSQNMPNASFDGWIMQVGNSTSNPPTTVTVYASCAPAKE